MSGFWHSTWFSVVVALAVPIVWGVFSAWLFDKLRARQQRRANCRQGPDA